MPVYSFWFPRQALEVPNVGGKGLGTGVLCIFQQVKPLGVIQYKLWVFSHSYYRWFNKFGPLLVQNLTAFALILYHSQTLKERCAESQIHGPQGSIHVYNTNNFYWRTKCRNRSNTWETMITFSFQNSWKDPNNDFRKHLKVTAVPTLLKYGTVSVFLFIVHPCQKRPWHFIPNITLVFRVH